MTYHSNDYAKLENKWHTWLFNPFKSATLKYVSLKPPPSGTVTDESESLDPESKEEMIPTKQKPPGTKDNVHHISTTPSSLPDSLFGLDCWCGIIGDGNVHYQSDQLGEAIQCDECKNLLHIACQHNGRASNLNRNSAFICDFCDPRHILPLRILECKYVMIICISTFTY